MLNSRSRQSREANLINIISYLETRSKSFSNKFPITRVKGRRSHTGVWIRPALFTFHFGEFGTACESDVVVAVICHFYAFYPLPRVLN